MKTLIKRILYKIRWEGGITIPFNENFTQNIKEELHLSDNDIKYQGANLNDLLSVYTQMVLCKQAKKFDWEIHIAKDGIILTRKIDPIWFDYIWNDIGYFVSVTFLYKWFHVKWGDWNYDD